MVDRRVPAVLPRRRCLLSAPASDPRKTARALGSSADQVVLDLEDAVAPHSKDRARALLVDALAGWSDADAARVSVRVNAPRSPWCHLDLQALAELEVPPGSVLVPKVEGAADLAFVDRLLDGLEARAGGGRRMGVQAIVETARGLERVAEIARAGERLEAIVLGYADLAASLGLAEVTAVPLELWLPAQHAVLLAARSAGVQALDGPHVGVDVDDRFTAAARRARDLGFDGKWAIHPRQVDVLNGMFTPDAGEVARARAVLRALEGAGRVDQAGAAALDGEMVDEAVATGARRVLARAGLPLGEPDGPGSG